MLGARGTAHIDLQSLRENVAVVRRAAPGLSCIAVVKADAYGHGAVPIARALVETGVEQLAVVSVAEGVELRDAGIDPPILLLGGFHSMPEAQVASERDLTPTLHHPEGLGWIREVARTRPRPWRVQLKVDTGMRRMGVDPADVDETLGELSGASEVELEGLYTHLACADDPDPTFSRSQLAQFREVLARAADRGLTPPQIHFENSAALLDPVALREELPEATAVRPGLMLYGARPSGHLDVELSPVMSLRAPVVNLREIASGDSVGYGATYRAPGATRVATLPLGYADGVPCSLANRGSVWIRGARHPIVGRVSMDYTTVDVGDSNVVIGDTAVLFGRDEGGSRKPVIAVEEVADCAGTIPYEILVRVGQRIHRRTD